MNVMVAKLKFTAASGLGTLVRLTADDQVTQTDVSYDKAFYEVFRLFIPQGTEEVVVELMDEDESTVYASLVLDPILDLRLGTDAPGFDEQELTMDELRDDMTRAKIVIGFFADDGDKRFDDIIARTDGGVDQATVEHYLERARQSLESSGDDDEKAAPSQLEVSAWACTGPVVVWSQLGSRREAFLGVRGPPTTGDWQLGVWLDRESFEKGMDAFESINLLRVVAVQAEPSRSDMFIVVYMLTRTQKQRLVCQRLDRSREVWVEMLKVVVQFVHEMRAKRLKHKKHTKEEEDKN